MPARNPADIVLRARYRQTVLFPDLTERLALRLSSIVTYTARAHFGAVAPEDGRPRFHQPDRGLHAAGGRGARGDRRARRAAGSPSWCAARPISPRSSIAPGDVRHLVREGRHTVLDPAARWWRGRSLVNVFTRYDPDPARRRVTDAAAASSGWARRRRVSPSCSTVDALVPAGRRARFRRAAATASGTTARPTPTAT